MRVSHSVILIYAIFSSFTPLLSINSLNYFVYKRLTCDKTALIIKSITRNAIKYN
jgi:hypothetical protein